MDIYKQRTDALPQHDNTPEQRRVSQLTEAVLVSCEQLEHDIDRMSAPEPLPQPPVSANYDLLAEVAVEEPIHDTVSLDLHEAARNAAIPAKDIQLFKDVA
jgi:hypothetical protein